MNVLLLLLAIAALLLPRLVLADDGKPLNLQLKPKALLTPQADSPAPFARPVEEGHPLDFSTGPSPHEGVHSACAPDSTWCYDMNDGNRSLVYRPARNFMPQINGLTAENISVKRDRIVFRYSFR